MRNIFNRLFAFIMLLCAPLALTACNFSNSAAPAVVSQVQMDYSKAMYVAEASFKGVSTALEAAVDSGQLKGESAAKALKAYENIKATLDKARTTKQTADALLAQSYISDLWSALSAFAL